MSELLVSVGDRLKATFGDAILASSMDYDFPVFEVKRDKIEEIARFLYDDPDMGFRFLTTLCGLHFPEQKGKELGVMYQFHNLPKNHRIRIKTFFPVSDPTVPSLTGIFASANWQERQEYDFFGIRFTGHPNLKRILNMDEMNYYPMRKEYRVEDGGRSDKNDAMFGR
ncbi:MAG: NADH-quinone oxidoreductase subunit C [Bacteroidia bacterium]|nr:NADH-quinone oxidoreductase subunit C [Bacteroidia bacterium]